MMPKKLKIKKGLNLNLIGSATGEISELTDISNEFAIIPDDFCGITPKLFKKEGDSIKAGEALFYDKNHPEIHIVSPVSGTVSDIKRGERRKILAIIIKAYSGDSQKFIIPTDTSGIKTTLLSSGLWAMMRQRPYGIVPNPDTSPRDIFISTFDSSPLSPDHTLLIDNNEAYFKKGVEILNKLTSGNVYIGCRKDYFLETDNSTSIIFEGPHPAGNIGTQIAAVKPVNKGETVWTVDSDTVVRIGHLFTNGFVDFSCIVAITGESVETPRFAKAIAGIALKDLLGQDFNEENKRIISGNVLTGIRENIHGYLHFPYRQITVIPEIANDCELLGWASLSHKKFSASRTFFSWLMPKSRKYHFDAKLNGGERAIIMAGEYDKVFPMDIYAEFLIKAIIARDIEKMEQLGIYEVVPEDFALCEFIDTSKLPLQKIVREGLDYIRKEMN